MEYSDKGKKKGKIKKKKVGSKVLVKNEDGTVSSHEKMIGSGRDKKVRTRVDAKGNAHYRPAKEPRYKVVKKSPEFDSKKRKVTKRKFKAGYGG